MSITIITKHSSTASSVPSAGSVTDGELALNTADVALYAKNSSGSVKSIMNNPTGLKYPTTDGTNGQLITTNGAGVLSWYTPTTGTGDVVGPASATDKAIATFNSTTGKLIQNNTGATITSGVITATGFSGPLNGSVGATTPSTVVATQVDITAQGDLRLQDTSGGEYVGFQAPGTVASSVLWTLPNADGTSNQVLTTNGSGTLSWSTPSAGVTTGKSIALAMIFGF